MTFARRWATRLRLLSAFVREYLVFDAGPVRKALGLVGLAIGLLLYRWGRRRKGLAILAKVHQHDLLGWANSRIEKLVREVARPEAQPSVLAEHVESVRPLTQSRVFFQTPEKLFVSSAMVLKAHGPGERGVLLLNYSYLYPVFAHLFDVPAVLERYHLVLEPSWSGYCDLDILSYARYGRPVFVESIEPRDTRFLRGATPNLVPVPVAGNWWADHRVFRPLPDTVKDVDVCMVAGWADYKRHARFFAALSRLRRRGVRLRVLLLGYPFGRTKDDILDEARLHGVADQLEVHERLPPEEVNRQLNRARVNVLWSRREGFNRAVIEGMLAGVPCLMRVGMNYGWHYPYINPRTGRFSSENDLSRNLVEMVETHAAYSPREWVMEHMTCQKGTAILNEAIKAVALASGETWTRDLVVKTSELHGLCYWNPKDAERFAEDYEFLRSTIRRRGIGEVNRNAADGVKMG